jgi:hypothetical protein
LKGALNEHLFYNGGFLTIPFAMFRATLAKSGRAYDLDEVEE